MKMMLVVWRRQQMLCRSPLLISTLNQYSHGGNFAANWCCEICQMVFTQFIEFCFSIYVTDRQREMVGGETESYSCILHINGPMWELLRVGFVGHTHKWLHITADVTATLTSSRDCDIFDVLEWISLHPIVASNRMELLWWPRPSSILPATNWAMLLSMDRCCDDTMWAKLILCCCYCPTMSSSQTQAVRVSMIFCGEYWEKLVMF